MLYICILPLTFIKLLPVTIKHTIFPIRFYVRPMTHLTPSPSFFKFILMPFAVTFFILLTIALPKPTYWVVFLEESYFRCFAFISYTSELPKKFE